MNRRDANLDAMLRLLGVAYYDSLHGMATQADVDRAVGSLAGRFGEEPPKPPPGGPKSAAYRPDSQIAGQVREILAESLPGGPTGVDVMVHDGVVTLTGAPELTADAELIKAALRPIWDVDGVVDVVNKVGPATASVAAAAG
jgi:hypothetical protein